MPGARCKVQGGNDEKVVSTITRKLLAWFRKHGRTHLPWRGDSDPYRVLVSELMLQQTQVERVIPYYRRWLKQFPTIARLAKASETDVLKVWQGLGYYRRARSLKKLADELVARGQKTLPTTRTELEALPGIGAYTAGAVLSFAFDQPEPAIDTNVRRVITRIFGCNDDKCDDIVRQFFGRLRRHADPDFHQGKLDQHPNAHQRLDSRALGVTHEDVLASRRGNDRCFSPRDINSALMDLGALVCQSRAPKCDACPLSASCAAYANGTIGNTRNASRLQRRPRAEIAIGVLREGKNVYVGSHGALLIAPLDDMDARAALKAFARERYGVEIAVRPAAVHTMFNEKPASLHRCSLLYGKTNAFRIAPVEALERLPQKQRDVLQRVKLL